MDDGLRRPILGVLALGIAGVETELLLLGHTETTAQWLPLGLLAVGLASVVTRLLSATRATVRALGATMAAFVLAGIVGLYLHYKGNAEFELEMYPSMEGFELVREALTGATPALAPGTMILLGLIGLVACHKDPVLTEGE